MKYVKLGKSDLKVSKVCMGCMGFGDPENGMHTWTLPERESAEIIEYGLDKGINFYDTAIGYQNGTSEQYLGKTIKEHAEREDVVIATKFLPRTQDEIKNNITGQEHIKQMTNKSLENLGLDYIDLYIYHMWDFNTPINDILEGLNQLIDEGLVRYIGISNCFAWQLVNANMTAKNQGFKEFISVQGHYNLLFREQEREMMPMCHEKNIATTPYSSLASGRLSRMPNAESKRLKEDGYAKTKYDATMTEDNIIIERVNELANNYDVTMTEISLSWLEDKVTSPIVGATKTSHVEGAVKSVELRLNDDDKRYLEEAYVPHKLVGVMAENKSKLNDEKKVWIKSTKNKI